MNEFKYHYYIERARTRTLYTVLKDVSRRMKDHCFSAYMVPIDELKRLGLLDTWVMCERTQFMIYQNNNQRHNMTKLERPFPSAPKFGPVYEIKIKRNDAFSTFNTCAVYPMVHFLKLLMGETPWHWVSDNRIDLENGIILKSKHLKRFMTWKLSDDEAAWILPLPYNYYARQIGHNESYSEACNALRVDRYDATEKPKQDAKRRPRRSEAQSRATNDANTSSARSNQFEFKPKVVTPPSGATFGIPELVTATGLDASKVRALLRKATTKPTGGWEFNKSDWDKIFKIVSK